VLCPTLGQHPGSHTAGAAPFLAGASAAGLRTAVPFPWFYLRRIRLCYQNTAKSKIKMKSKHPKLHRSKERVFDPFFSILRKMFLPEDSATANSARDPLRRSKSIFPCFTHCKEVTSLNSYGLSCPLPALCGSCHSREAVDCVEKEKCRKE